MKELDHKRIKELESEIHRLREENEFLRKRKKIKKTCSSWLGNHSTNIFAGRNLKKSLVRLYTELPGQPSKETLADVSSHLIWRLTRVGAITLMIATVPLLIMVMQTVILNIQNEKNHKNPIFEVTF